MCGIVGYVGRENAREIIIDGLKRLEYRGYDSAGIAVVQNGKILLRKHVGEIANPDLTLMIYPGADGDFTLYDDAGDGYGYEQGECARIALHWDDASRTLSFSARQGSYPGMPQMRRFLLRLVGREEEMPVVYDGRGMSVVLGSSA